MRASLGLIAVAVAVMAGAVASARGAGTPPASINGRYGVNVGGFYTVDIPAVGSQPARHMTKTIKERVYLPVSHGALDGHPIIMFTDTHGNVKWSVGVPGGTATWSFIFSKGSFGWEFIGSAHYKVVTNGVTLVGEIHYGGENGRKVLQPTRGNALAIPLAIPHP